MSIPIQFYGIITTLIIAFGIGLYRINIIDDGAKLICLLLGISILSESIAYYCALRFHTNILVYNIYGLIEFFILCEYYNLTIDVFIKSKIGLYVGCIGTIGGMLNMLFIQSALQINTYFMFFEGFCITGMSLFAFYKLLLNNEQLRVTRYPHFWFTSVFLFSWNISIINWGTYDLIGRKFPAIVGFLNSFIWSIDILCYLAFGTIFLLYPKMQTKDE